MSSFLEELISMGFDEYIARIAVENNTNGSIDDAINWILAQNSEIAQNSVETQENLKLVLVVRDDLQMTPGKVAAQCVHAALAVVRIVETSNPVNLGRWKRTGETTICLKCSGPGDLELLESSASSIGLPTSMVRDAGRTQVAPSTQTVLAIGPAPVSEIDSITGHLRLY